MVKQAFIFRIELRKETYYLFKLAVQENSKRPEHNKAEIINYY